MSGSVGGKSVKKVEKNGLKEGYSVFKAIRFHFYNPEPGGEGENIVEEVKRGRKW
jgi:hypothetical protein